MKKGGIANVVGLFSNPCSAQFGNTLSLRRVEAAGGLFADGRAQYEVFANHRAPGAGPGRCETILTISVTDNDGSGSNRNSVTRTYPIQLSIDVLDINHPPSITPSIIYVTEALEEDEEVFVFGHRFTISDPDNHPITEPLPATASLTSVYRRCKQPKNQALL